MASRPSSAAARRPVDSLTGAGLPQGVGFGSRPSSALASRPSSATTRPPVNSVAVNNLPGTGPAKDAVVASGVTKDISRKLKSSGGHVLKSWLERKGVLMDATITKKQRAEMKTGVISSGKIAEAFELLNAKPSVPMSEIQSMKVRMSGLHEPGQNWTKRTRGAN
eukprot:742940-Rhodomonas_salina.1